jgi:hypothetical protein
MFEGLRKGLRSFIESLFKTEPGRPRVRISFMGSDDHPAPHLSNHGILDAFMKNGHDDGSRGCAAVKKLLSYGLGPDSPLIAGKTPLQWAVTYRNSPPAVMLIKAGADVNRAAFRSFETAPRPPRETVSLVSETATTGQAETLQALLEAGASPEGFDGEEMTPLMRAVMLREGEGGPECIRILAKAGADIERPCDRFTPLMRACSHDNRACVEALIESGADIRLGWERTIDVSSKMWDAYELMPPAGREWLVETFTTARAKKERAEIEAVIDEGVPTGEAKEPVEAPKKKRGRL